MPGEARLPALISLSSVSFVKLSEASIFLILKKESSSQCSSE